MDLRQRLQRTHEGRHTVQYRLPDSLNLFIGSDGLYKTYNACPIRGHIHSAG
jgi:hypothetical protein